MRIKNIITNVKQNFSWPQASVHPSRPASPSLPTHMNIMTTYMKFIIYTMLFPKTQFRRLMRALRARFLLLFLGLSSLGLQAANETINAGSFIVNMG